MGAWGSGPLTNDDAQDLIDELAPLDITGRALVLKDVFDDYEAFERRRPSPAPGVARPDEDDGSREAQRAIAAAWLVAAALERIERPAQPRLLAGLPAGASLALADATLAFLSQEVMR